MHDALSLLSGTRTARFAGVRGRLPFLSTSDEDGPDDGTSIDAEPPSRGRLTGVRERLPLVSSGEPAADVAESADTGPAWRDAMVAPIKESSLLTPNRALAVGGLLVGVGAVLSAYALLKRRDEQADPAEQTWGVAESETDATDHRERGGVVGLAFLLGWSALVRRLQREEGETTG